jgi:hypothetical protein
LLAHVPQAGARRHDVAKQILAQHGVRYLSPTGKVDG